MPSAERESEESAEREEVEFNFSLAQQRLGQRLGQSSTIGQHVYQKPKEGTVNFIIISSAEELYSSSVSLPPSAPLSLSYLLSL